jgi:hypothetical protein
MQMIFSFKVKEFDHNFKGQHGPFLGADRES